MKYLRNNNVSRRRSGHRSLYGRCTEKNFDRYKQGDSPFCDVTNVSDVFVNITEDIKTHSYRRRLKGHCKDHRFLYSALRSCYENNRDDEILISEILTELYACEGSLVAIFSILLPHHVIGNSFCLRTKMTALYPRSCAENPIDAFEFYLKHLTHSKRLAESFDNILNEAFEAKRGLFYTPLTAATTSRVPQYVLILLRYGADPFYVPDTVIFDCMQDPVASLITGLNSIIMFKRSFFNDETSSVLAEEENKGMECLEFITRATNTIPLVQNLQFKACEEDEGTDQNRPKEYNLHPKLAAKLNVPSFLGPRPLQHLCRLAVRQQIMSNHKRHTTLPSMIDNLPLPKSLKKYIDLTL